MTLETQRWILWIFYLALSRALILSPVDKLKKFQTWIKFSLVKNQDPELRVKFWPLFSENFVNLSDFIRFLVVLLIF